MASIGTVHRNPIANQEGSRDMDSTIFLPCHQTARIDEHSVRE